MNDSALVIQRLRDVSPGSGLPFCLLIL